MVIGDARIAYIIKDKLQLLPKNVDRVSSPKSPFTRVVPVTRCLINSLYLSPLSGIVLKIML
jgi:hypothetical protein